MAVARESTVVLSYLPTKFALNHTTVADSTIGHERKCSQRSKAGNPSDSVNENNRENLKVPPAIRRWNK